MNRLTILLLLPAATSCSGISVDAQNACTSGDRRCVGVTLQQCTDGQWASSVDCSLTAKDCDPSSLTCTSVGGDLADSGAAEDTTDAGSDLGSAPPDPGAAPLDEGDAGEDVAEETALPPPDATDLCTTTGGAVVCPPPAPCHDPGTCDPLTGKCSTPAALDGTPCDDADACSLDDACQGGSCSGTAVVCTAAEKCHVAGTCDPATGACSKLTADQGTPCNDGNACTEDDACGSGVCAGKAKICFPLDACHVAGSCDPATGTCSDPNVDDGKPCDDQDACTKTDACQTGSCVGANAVICTAPDACHAVGKCDKATGVCSQPKAADGTPCDDENECTSGDACSDGACTHAPATGLCNGGNGYCSSSDCVTCGAADVACASGCVPSDDANCSACGAACAAGSKCIDKVCVVPSCTDSLKNGLETDVDCGGETCGGCKVSKSCNAGSDCLTGRCNNGRCAFDLSLGVMKAYPANGVNTIGLVAGLLNDDAWMDIVTTNHGPGGGGTTISVFLGKGDGTMQSATPFACTSGPFGPTLGDFNGDTIADLLVPAYKGVSVLLGVGDGAFVAPKSPGLPPGISLNTAATAGDFNGDGRLDVLAGDGDDGGAGYVDVLLGKGNGTIGDGTLEAGAQYKVLNGIPQVTAALINSDAFLDAVAVTSSAKDTGVLVLTGKGDGTFGAPLTAPVSGQLNHVTATDVDADGFADLVVDDREGNLVWVLYGNGAGVFPKKVQIVTGAGPEWPSVADMDGDGRLDLVVPNAYAQTVGVYLANGDRTFQVPLTVAVGAQPEGVVLVDLNGDGKTDVGVNNYGDNALGVLLNTSPGQ